MALLFLPIALSGSICLSEQGGMSLEFTPCACAAASGGTSTAVSLEASPECGPCHDYSISLLASGVPHSLPAPGPVAPFRSDYENAATGILALVGPIAQPAEPPGNRLPILRC